jgi:ABC-type Na+ transport system ATPase subunit NatA
VHILSCDDLRATFADGVEAVRGGLRRARAERAGKTTTMRMRGTLLTPSGGRA